MGISSLKIITTFIAAGSLLIGVAQAGYENAGWPIQQKADGSYGFTKTGKAGAVNYCTGFYAADVKSRLEHSEGETEFGKLIRAHSVHMRDAYQAKYTGDQAALDKLITDLEWHFANSAQHEAYQDFRDGSEQACEAYALENAIITPAYMDGFIAQLTQ